METVPIVTDEENQRSFALDIGMTNSQRNIVIKENRTFWIADPAGQASSNEHGLYTSDTRVLADYRWNLSEAPVLLQTHSTRMDAVGFRYARFSGPDQILAVRRKITMSDGGLEEMVSIRNHSSAKRQVTLYFSCRADFTDIFVIRGFSDYHRGAIHTTVVEDAADTIDATLTYRSEWFEGVASIRAMAGQGKKVVDRKITVENSAEGVLRFSFCTTLEREGEQVFLLKVTAATGARPNRAKESRGLPPLPGYDGWFASFPEEWMRRVDPLHRPALRTAITDLRGLLFTTSDGLYPAAGIPWYVTVFGRDALIAAHFIHRWRPDVALGVLRHLSRYQGKKVDSQTEEAPGKILHELRAGELAARSAVPHRPYYGTVDATALFVILCGELARLPDHWDTIYALRAQWEAALRWITDFGDIDGDGFVEYDSNPGDDVRYVTQSWKDSNDSMSHADGVLAGGHIAGAEVQGYSYAAFMAAAEMYKTAGEDLLSRQWADRAEKLRESFDKAFWLDRLGTFAMALDGNKQPLAVHSSNAGHLLWTGVVLHRRVDPLVRSLFAADLWTGWGFRTLGSRERRYNPLSYHNGSVWPHDTAIGALGLARYGLEKEAKRISTALFDLAAAEPDGRLPELVGGYERGEEPAVPYPVACRPQAWDAAALVALAAMELPGF